jgi:aspartyl-tRNA(Asn)/glutamyl-tRNA(Gln) amidotransferase subunit A
MASSSAAWRTGAAALARAFHLGELDPRDVLDVVLERHAATHPQLNASVLVDEAGARDAAAQSAERWRRGKPLSRLDGVPVTVKDNIPVRGLPCSWGSLLFADRIATGDDIAVERLRAAGAVLWAKTNTPELAMAGITEKPVFGVTRNPWDLSRTPGGSSGGARRWSLRASGPSPSRPMRPARSAGLPATAAWSACGRRPAWSHGCLAARASRFLLWLPITR